MQIVEKRVIYIAISVVLILAGIVGMIVNAGMGNGAFSTDVEFSGGTSIEVSIGKEFENNGGIAGQWRGKTSLLMLIGSFWLVLTHAMSSVSLTKLVQRDNDSIFCTYR